jgi:hypothetical protein
LLPDIEDQVTTVAYEHYCQWAQDTAAEHGTEPAVAKQTIFTPGHGERSGQSAPEALGKGQIDEKSRRTTR